jgi:hypothetical protein
MIFRKSPGDPKISLPLGSDAIFGALALLQIRALG